ncbi:mitochondrial chaperone BCS1 [Fusarium oxysporum f. sp. lycopersici MN25]|nr:mitochondrial chaperone BCS1 [Fusarium oxysporum f. sp. lycopersici MN25]
MWQQVAGRPIRPTKTVILAHEEKHNVLRDIHEYLNPKTAKWYASPSIPLRRGCLFHGSIGTGKTNFSFTLAGVFGVDIDVISLQHDTVSEVDLAVLFTILPRRSVVLLEDIDTTGPGRSNDDDDEGIGERSGEGNGEDIGSSEEERKRRR